MQDFRNPDVWQRARRLTKTVYEMTADFHETEVFGLRSQMRRASVSVCSNIAEGCGRTVQETTRTRERADSAGMRLVIAVARGKLRAES